MLRKCLAAALCLVVLVALTVTSASADSGPKPSVVVQFQSLAEEECFVTLLSKTSSTGPHSAFNGNTDNAHYAENSKDFDIWEKFVSYKDADGFYFLQFFSKLGEDRTFRWTYFPPQEFKILMYFPKTDAFAVSGSVYERYAFDSYYVVDASQLGAQPVDGQSFAAVKSYDYATETVSLVARVFITIILELAVALLFGFRTKKQLIVIGLANVVTQTGLNVLLNLINYHNGQAAYVLNYIWMECLVFALEAVLYYATLNKLGRETEEKERKPVLYALVANAGSFVAGLVAAHLIPGIF